MDSNEVIHDNLVVRATKRLLDLSGLKQKIGINFYLKKKIPIGAGLGGGSSNAARVLVSLNRALGLAFTTHDLIKLSKDLGEDIEFFLLNKSCVYFDGDESKIVSLNKKLNLLLIKPDFSIATREVYDLLRKEVSTKDLQPVVQKDRLFDYIISGQNQLYHAVKRINPLISEVLEILNNQKGVIAARMTGSGSTCFGIFETSVEVDSAIKKITQKYPKWSYYRAQV